MTIPCFPVYITHKIITLNKSRLKNQSFNDYSSGKRYLLVEGNMREKKNSARALGQKFTPKPNVVIIVFSQAQDHSHCSGSK